MEEPQDKKSSNTNLADQILGNFGLSLQKLIQEAVGDKIKELNTKEQALLVREKKVDRVLKNLHNPENNGKTGCITLRVGDKLFYTTASILLSVKDSYFSGLLNEEFSKPTDGVYFIAREGHIFEYVLEYLIYGQLISNITDENVLRKLNIDADFYLLPQLKEEVEQQMKGINNTPIGCGAKPYAKFDNAAHGGNGQFWQWNQTKFINANYFALSTQSYQNDTVTVKQAGTYLVLIRTSFTNSSNSVYLALYVNGAGVASCYNEFNSNYICPTSISELFQFKAGDRLQVYQSYNNGPLNGNPYNQFSIMYVGE